MLSRVLCSVFFLIDPLLLEMEIQEMGQRLSAVEEMQKQLLTKHNKILETQDAILSHLDSIKRAIQPQTHSTPYQNKQPSSRPWRQKQQCNDECYGMERQQQWINDGMYESFQPDPVLPLPTASLSPIVRRPLPQTNPVRRRTSDSYSQEFVTDRTQPTTGQHSFELPNDGNFGPESFPVKCGDNIVPSSAIDMSKLVPISVILCKFPKLRCDSKVGTLAVKLAREAMFGDDVMVKCTVMGEQELPGLPAAELFKLKRVLFPKLWTSKQEFEPLWKGCVDAMG